jgi:hypothetical protein
MTEKNERMLEEDDENEYKLKRKRNNESVKQCRERDKLKMQKAREDVEKFKNENQTLKEKYEALEKELNLLKSLFNQNNSVTCNTLPIATNDMSTSNPIQNPINLSAAVEILENNTSQ